MASKHQMTGMRGVFMVAAELSRLGFIVSTTSRSAAGADLLVTDQGCQNAWSVQVKTNSKPANFWLLGRHAKRLTSASHIYVFVNIGNETRKDEYIVVRSAYVAEKLVYEKSSSGSEWYSFMRADRPSEDAGWSIFGDPHLSASSEDSSINS